MTEEEVKWRDALGLDIELGSLYVYCYKQNGLNYPIKAIVIEKTTASGYRRTVPKVKVLKYDGDPRAVYWRTDRRQVRKQTIELIRLFVRVSPRDAAQDPDFQHLMSDPRVKKFIEENNLDSEYSLYF